MDYFTQSSPCQRGHCDPGLWGWEAPWPLSMVEEVPAAGTGKSRDPAACSVSTASYWFIPSGPEVPHLHQSTIQLDGLETPGEERLTQVVLNPVLTTSELHQHRYYCDQDRDHILRNDRSACAAWQMRVLTDSGQGMWNWSFPGNWVTKV